MIKPSSLNHLKTNKNLLAFSAGGDSTALFFILIENNIQFDIAIVNYNIREQSKEEVEYAQELAEKYHLKCHLLNAQTIEKNMEAKARAIRYDFFEELIEEYNYQTLLTAHHLGDRFEWLLMQFCKGAGCAEMAGMQVFQKRDTYTLLRPLLDFDKKELLEYLHKNDIQYFEDETNFDEDIKRNEFRHNYSTPLIDKYRAGIKKSFEYLDEDVATLLSDIEVTQIDDFSYFKASHSKRSDIFAIDKHIKSLGHIITAKERGLLKVNATTIVGRKFIVNFERGYVFIIPYSNEKIVMHKRFKEECRKLNIEPKLRTYFAQNEKIFLIFKELMLHFSAIPITTL